MIPQRLPGLAQKKVLALVSNSMVSCQGRAQRMHPLKKLLVKYKKGQTELCCVNRHKKCGGYPVCGLQDSRWLLTLTLTFAESFDHFFFF